MREIFDQRFIVPVHEVRDRIHQPTLIGHARELREAQPFLGALPGILGGKAWVLRIGKANHIFIVEHDRCVRRMLEPLEVNHASIDQ